MFVVVHEQRKIEMHTPVCFQ